jgi:hypothetical protein
MKYERKISASLYVLNGVSKCLHMHLSNTDDHAGPFLRSLHETVRKKQNRGSKRGHKESSSRQQQLLFV